MSTCRICTYRSYTVIRIILIWDKAVDFTPVISVGVHHSVSAAVLWSILRKHCALHSDVLIGNMLIPFLLPHSRRPCAPGVAGGVHHCDAWKRHPAEGEITVLKIHGTPLQPRSDRRGWLDAFARRIWGSPQGSEMAARVAFSSPRSRSERSSTSPIRTGRMK